MEEERGNVPESMQPWQSDGPQGHLRESGDVPDPGLFTDLVPAIPVCKLKQKTKTVEAVFYLILLVLFSASVISSAILVPPPHNRLIKSVTCTCNAVLLAITGILQRHLVAEQQKEKRQGYIKFSKRLDWIIHMPFFIFSIGTTGVLLVIVWQPKQREDEKSSLFMIRFLILLEVALTAVVIGAYLRMVCRHRSIERRPDVMNSLYSALNPPVSMTSARYSDGGLAEQQAMLLHYQQDNLRYLSEEILRLQETLSKFDGSQDRTTPQVDVVHHLAAREQELRAVTAERDQLLAELRLARSLIAERDADIKHVQSVNHQYFEENNRVRAMLEEWSSRTAKLEISLEAERLSNAELQKRLALLRHHSGDPK